MKSENPFVGNRETSIRHAPRKESIPLKEFLGEFSSSTVSACVTFFSKK